MSIATLRFNLKTACERVARGLGEAMDRRWRDDEPGAFFGPRCG